MCISNWLGHCLSLRASGTASLPSTDTPVGLRHSLYLTSPLRQSLKPLSPPGCPQQITTDQGRQFEARLFKALAAITGSSLTQTTAWHPASNSIIERLHHQPKAALMCHADEHWAEALPLVLLGIRSAWKEDLQASSAQLLYSSPLRLPWEFFAPSSADCTDVTDFASRLRVHIGKLRPVPASRHAASSTFIFKDLATASHVFLKHGAPREALQAPYVSPYQVLHRGDKTYTTNVQGSEKTASIDCLKPVYVLHHTKSASLPAIPSSITTRSGRRYAFRITWGCTGLSGGVVWWAPQASPPT